VSARVNLLPPELHERRLLRRTALYTGAGLTVLVLLLGLVLAVKVVETSRARVERDLAQAELDQLQLRVAELAPYRELADRLESRNAVLASAMSKEIAWARVLSDLSGSFPDGASLTTLVATAAQPVEGGAVGEPAAVEGTEPSAASVQFTGYSVQEYAPGIERVLIDFDRSRSFFGPYLASAEEQEIGEEKVTTFSSTVQITESAYSGRYELGLPEGAAK
jgi:Tfp pilus assembly protein PilN